ncbi:MAG TPA: crossover junction endodeoxyribonuclease RuvC [Labilithrix sp.]
MTRVLGLDPGTRRFGWGVVSREGTRLVHVAHGVIDVEGEGTLGERLVRIEAALVRVVEESAPEEASIESLFFAKDASAAAKLGHARGVGLLVCARAGLEAFEYAPAQVKRTVAGAGQADKSQVAQMVRILLGLSETPPADAADALAVSITHLQGRAYTQKTRNIAPSRTSK